MFETDKEKIVARLMKQGLINPEQLAEAEKSGTSPIQQAFIELGFQLKTRSMNRSRMNWGWPISI